MPKNIPIEGGQPIGAPQGWDAEKHGPCGTLQVATIQEPGAYPRMITAHRFTEMERMAILNDGEAALFLSILGTTHPVISMWLQDGRGQPVGDGLEIGQGEAIAKAAQTSDTPLVEIGFAAMFAELEAQAEQRSNSPDIGDPDPAGQIWMKGIFAMKDAFAVGLEAVGLHLAQGRKAAESETVELPVMTLQAVAAEAQARDALGMPPAGILKTTGTVDRDPFVIGDPLEGLDTCVDCQGRYDSSDLDEEGRCGDCQGGMIGDEE